jgi:hypothetical protein
MKTNALKISCQGFLFISGFIFLTNTFAHGDMDWNDFIIDNKNDLVIVNIKHVKKVISDVVLARRAVPRWPDQELVLLEKTLADLQEELDDLLGHFKEDGINIRNNKELHEHPRAGRSVSANMAIEATMALVEHINSLENSQAFESELHEDGIGAYMFDLMDSYLEQMSLYGDLLKSTQAHEHNR